MPEPVVFDIRSHIPINGKTVLRAEQLTQTAENGKLLYQGLSFALKPGMKVALLGPNGSGKTTLLEQLFKRGEGIHQAPGCAIGMLRQQLEQLNATDTILQTVRKYSRYSESDIRVSLARIGFRRESVFRAGEFNLLLLDEPTNYLDAEAREQIETTLAAYPGTIVFASHDRRLARGTASHALELREGSARFVEGKPFDS